MGARHCLVLRQDESSGGIKTIRRKYTHGSYLNEAIA